MSGTLRFSVFIAVAFVVFVFVLRATLRDRVQRPSWVLTLTMAFIVVVGGMGFAKFGQNSGLPWWVYYTAPLLVTIMVPPLVFRMNPREALTYLALAFLSSPVIHVVFSFFLGWKEYMPFIKIPAIWEL